MLESNEPVHRPTRINYCCFIERTLQDIPLLWGDQILQHWLGINFIESQTDCQKNRKLETCETTWFSTELSFRNCSLLVHLFTEQIKLTTSKTKFPVFALNFSTDQKNSIEMEKIDSCKLTSEF